LRALFWAVVVLIAACAPARDYSEHAFQRWITADAARGREFHRFEDMLRAEGVSGVVPDYQLWRVDQLMPGCANRAFLAPPDRYWRNILPTLRFIRDHVKPALGDLEIVSGYRDPVLNNCIHGAPRSMHRGFYALDLLPTDTSVSAGEVERRLCAIHAAEGRRANIGLGLYAARRFHIDARGYRGWGGDHHTATFPCATR